MPIPPPVVLVLVLHFCAVTVSSTGAGNQFQGDDNGHVGRPCQVSPALPFPECVCCELRGVCVYYCRTYYKAVRGGGEEESGGQVL